MTDNRPGVGIGLLLINKSKILLGKRKSPLGQGEYGGPGGKLESLESFEECVLRELAEEAGPLKVKNLRFLCVTNMRKYAPLHYVDIGMTAELVSGNPVVMEPDKLESWHWYDMDKLPSPLFAVELNYIVAYRTGQMYFSKEITSLSKR